MKSKPDLKPVKPTRPLYYKLDGSHNPVPVSDSLEWAKSFEDMKHRRVDVHTLKVSPTIYGENEIMISTVFLGMDHRFMYVTGEEKPLLFETMVFGGEYDGYQNRYESWSHAVMGHYDAVILVEQSLRPARQMRWLTKRGISCVKNYLKKLTLSLVGR